MSKQYVMSDVDMVIASQIAYLDAGGSNQPNVTVSEIIDNARSKYGVYNEKTGSWEPRTDIKLSEKQKSQLETANYLQSLMEEHGALYARNWKVVDRCDKNDSTGFYGCLIDTGDGDAIMGFRGSESFDASQYIKDWKDADLELLNNTLTVQQMDAEEYTRYIYEKYGDDYKTFSFTGHSLGGNLAQHAGNMAPDGMRDKIDHVISWDGPGFSDEYILMHWNEIQASKDYQTHYQWSLVGSLLTTLPGTENRVIRAHDDKDSDGGIIDTIKSMFFRHHTRNIEFGPDGSVQDGTKSILAVILGPLSAVVDYSSWVTYIICPVLGTYNLLVKNTIYKQIYELVYNKGVGLEEAYKKWEKNVKNLIRDLITPDVSGNFTANIDSIYECEQALNLVEQRMYKINDEVHEIERTLMYDSICGTYVKSSLKLMRLAINCDAQKVGKAAKIATNCSQRYHNADKSAEDRFYSTGNKNL